MFSQMFKKTFKSLVVEWGEPPPQPHPAEKEVFYCEGGRAPPHPPLLSLPRSPAARCKQDPHQPPKLLKKLLSVWLSIERFF